VREICRRASERAAHREVRGYSTAGGKHPCVTHHQFMIQASLDHIEYLEKTIAELDRQINEKLKDYHHERELLEEIPGVKEQGSASILAEIGVDMNAFPSAEHLSAWAGMSPGSNESAGKKKC